MCPRSCRLSMEVGSRHCCKVTLLTTTLEIMSDIFNSDNWGKYGMGDEMSGASIEVLKQYMERLEAIKPRATNSTFSELAESDSQDSQQFYSDIDRQTMIHVSSSFELQMFSSNMHLTAPLRKSTAQLCSIIDQAPRRPVGNSRLGHPP